MKLLILSTLLFYTIKAEDQIIEDRELSYKPCSEEKFKESCQKGGTKYCEIINSSPGYRCVCKPGFQGPECSVFDYELKCDQSFITVKAKKSYFDDMDVENVSKLHLNDNGCGAKQEMNSYDDKIYYIWTIPGSPRNCKSTLSKNATHLIYSNAIRDADNTADNDLVTRSRIEIKFHCSFPVNYRLSLNKQLKPKVKTISFTTARGKFTVDLKMFNDANFQREWRPSTANGPIEVAKGQRLYIQLSLKSILHEIASKLVVDECWATPGELPVQDTVHQLIQTGCPSEHSVKIFDNGVSRFARFEFQMFAFRELLLDEDIHLHCVVRVCGTDCVNPCNNRKRRSLEDDLNEAIDEEINLITSAGIKVTMPGQESQEGRISRDKEEIENKNMSGQVSDTLLVVLVVVLCLVIAAIGIGVYMVVQKKRTALADQILEDSVKPKLNPQSAAGTSFSVFFGL